MTAFVYDSFAFEKLEEMLRLLALSYADLYTHRERMIVSERECEKEREKGSE